jgi:hypothetical protein
MYYSQPLGVYNAPLVTPLHLLQLRSSVTIIAINKQRSLKDVPRLGRIVESNYLCKGDSPSHSLGLDTPSLVLGKYVSNGHPNSLSRTRHASNWFG